MRGFLEATCQDRGGPRDGLRFSDEWRAGSSDSVSGSAERSDELIIATLEAQRSHVSARLHGVPCGSRALAGDVSSALANPGGLVGGACCAGGLIGFCAMFLLGALFGQAMQYYARSLGQTKPLGRQRG